MTDPHRQTQLAPRTVRVMDSIGNPSAHDRAMLSRTAGRGRIEQRFFRRPYVGLRRWISINPAQKARARRGFDVAIRREWRVRLQILDRHPEKRPARRGGQKGIADLAVPLA